MKQIGYGKAHGKIILIGEHAVVYGHPGISVPFAPLKVFVEAKRSSDDFLDISFYRGPLASAPEILGFLIVLIADLKETLGLKHVSVDIKNNIPESAGMGSSAAISNAVVAAMYDLAEVFLDEKTQFEKTQIAEKIMHGSPSGIDALQTRSEHAHYFVKGKDPEPLSIDLPGYLIVAHSQVKGETRAAVKNIAKLYIANLAQGHLESLGLMSLLMKEALEKKEIDDIARLMNQAHFHLQELTVSHPIVDQMVEQALNDGALGAKVTGGGLGGCIIALAETEIAANKILDGLKRFSGDQQWMMRLST
jgi:mevalonate kinase